MPFSGIYQEKLLLWHLFLYLAWLYLHFFSTHDGQHRWCTLKSPKKPRHNWLKILWKEEIRHYMEIQKQFSEMGISLLIAIKLNWWTNDTTRMKKGKFTTQSKTLQQSSIWSCLSSHDSKFSVVAGDVAPFFGNCVHHHSAQVNNLRWKLYVFNVYILEGKSYPCVAIQHQV